MVSGTRQASRGTSQSSTPFSRKTDRIVIKARVKYYVQIGSCTKLDRQHVRNRLQLAPSMLIAGPRRSSNPLLIHLSRLFNTPQLLQRLAAMKIRSRIICVLRQQRAEL